MNHSEDEYRQSCERIYRQHEIRCNQCGVEGGN
jgi:hypothetical protein